MGDQVDVFACPRKNEAARCENVPNFWNSQLSRELRKGGFVVEFLVSGVNGRLDTGGMFFVFAEGCIQRKVDGRGAERAFPWRGINDDDPPLDCDLNFTIREYQAAAPSLCGMVLSSFTHTRQEPVV